MQTIGATQGAHGQSTEIGNQLLLYKIGVTAATHPVWDPCNQHILIILFTAYFNILFATYFICFPVSFCNICFAMFSFVRLVVVSAYLPEVFRPSSRGKAEAPRGNERPAATHLGAVAFCGATNLFNV